MKIENQLKDYILLKYKDLKTFAEACNMPRTSLLNVFVRGVNSTRITNIHAICKTLNIDMEALVEGKIEEKKTSDFKLTLTEQKMLEKCRALDSFGSEAVNKIVNIEYSRNQFYGNEIEYAWKPLPDTGVSAGFGNEISDYGEMVKIPKTKVAMYSDYVIRVVGDSMEPLYYDGEYVLVKSQPDVDLGEVGIFIVDGESFIKEKGAGCLISKNKKYEPIKLDEWHDVRCYGKVLEKTEIMEE